MTAANDRMIILNYLYSRLASRDQRYCTIATVKKNTDITGSNQYILALADDLESSGLVITRQAYQMQGGKLFQITAAGFDAVENADLPTTVDSAAWTGNYDLSQNQKAELHKIIAQMRSLITEAKLSNARTANAMALLSAAETLIDTPDPLWPEIMRILRSPILGNVTGIAALIFAIVQVLIAAKT